MLVGMKTLIHSLIHQITSWWRERWHLSLALIAFRHQVEVLKRSGKRPQFSSSRTFLRNQTPELFDAEVSAELSGRFRAVLEQSFQRRFSASRCFTMLLDELTVGTGDSAAQFTDPPEFAA